MLKEEIEDYCRGLGLDTLGFIKCREFKELEEFYKYRKDNNLENEFEETDIEKRINPKLYMNEGKTIISIAFPYLWINSNNENGFSIYTKGLDYHRVVTNYLNKICTYIESIGGKAISFVDSNYLPERYIAYLAGVGFIGRNNMIITKKYGSYVFLGEIITDLNIYQEDKGSFDKINKYEYCGNCNNCYKECPTKSISINKINPNICSSYITQKKELSDIDIILMKGKIFGCDLCQVRCPYNEKVEYSKIDEFKPLEFMDDNIEIYANMNNKFFRENISRTSCGWRGKNIIKRNTIVKLFNQSKEINLYKGDSPYINDYIDRLNCGGKNETKD